MIEKLIEKFPSQFDSPFVLYIFLVAAALGWLLTKSEHVAAWKGLFSKDRSEKLKKAREELKDVPEEAAFYDEAVRQELFRKATGISCRRKYRQMCQKLVTDGVTSVEGIRQAYIYIDENNSKIEIKFSCIDKIMAAIISIPTLYGILAISASLVNIASLFNIGRFPNTLFILSTGILSVFFALQQLLPMAAALIIRKRLKEKEQKEYRSSSSPADELSSSAQET